MIGYLEGEIKRIGLNYLILYTNGIGYKVYVPNFLLQNASLEKKLSLEIYTHVKEDQFDLYGFKNIKELNFFEQLLDVSGVGPKAALNILSSSDLDSLKESIVKQDPTLLNSVSGIGRKTAEKIIVELKGKLGRVGQDMFTDTGSGDVYDALVGLGFKKDEIKRAISNLPKDLVTVEEKIKQALKILNRG